MHIPEIEVLDDSAKITFTYAMPTTPATECKLSYQVYGDGSIRTTLTYDPVEGLGDMPEFGVMFKFDADYDNVTWYGMGPEETYVDRCEGAKLVSTGTKWKIIWQNTWFRRNAETRLAYVGHL